MIYFTSDHHFGHENIIEYCDRSFTNVEQMDSTMIQLWNALVGDEDTVYHLGDFTLGGPEDAEYYFSQLNGHIMALANHWHHDRRWLPGPSETIQQGEVTTVFTPMGPSNYRSKSGHPVTLIAPLVIIQFTFPNKSEVPIVLCHYPFLIWDRQHYGSIHVHGHCHGKLKPMHPHAVDVGVDCWGFAPLSIERLLRHLTNQT